MQQNKPMKISGYYFDRQEFAGALGDLGTFLPLSIALITLNGLNASSVFLVAGLLYIGAGLYYGIPMPVQPLKAVAVIAIGIAASPQVIAAAAISMGVFLLVIRCFDPSEILSQLFPRPVIRGIQLSLGLILARKGFKLFLDHRFLADGTEIKISLAGFIIPLGLIVGLITMGLLIVLRENRRFPAGLIVIFLGILVGIITGDLSEFKHLSFGWEFPDLIIPGWNDFSIAIPVLLLPQLPLTFANSILATTDTAAEYFSFEARKVSPRPLFLSIGLANLLAGFIGGLPVCHGSGGLTAHYRFGARSGGSSIIIGSIFVFTALILGKAAPGIFNMLPLAVLGVMLLYVGVYHTFLIKDIIDNPWELSLALGMSAVTIVTGNLAVAFALGTTICLICKRLKIGAPLISAPYKLHPGIESRDR